MRGQNGFLHSKQLSIKNWTRKIIILPSGIRQGKNEQMKKFRSKKQILLYYTKAYRKKIISTMAQK